MVGGIIAGKINMHDLQTRMTKRFKQELTFLLNNRMGEDPGEQRWRSGKSTRLPLMWPEFKSSLASTPVSWVEFVVGSPPCSQRFFSWYSGFSPSLKTNTFKFQFYLERIPTCFVSKQITNKNHANNCSRRSIRFDEEYFYLLSIYRTDKSPYLFFEFWSKLFGICIFHEHRQHSVGL